MSIENGEWIMHGLDPDDPACIHTVEEMEHYIEDVGFLPLFAGGVPGFSAEEVTDPNAWWSGDPARDPWMWREIIAGRGRIAYGKFFDKKAGYISKAWFPVFANYRRSGYDFDARWDDELASGRQKKIMDCFMGKQKNRELLSSELKSLAGFAGGGEKNFEGTLAGLEMLTYLVCGAFRKRANKAGELYGWSIAVMCTPERLFGRKFVSRDYDKDPKESLERIVGRVMTRFPDADLKQVLRTVGLPEDRSKKMIF